MRYTQHREKIKFTKIKFSIRLQTADSTYLQGDSVVCEDTEDLYVFYTLQLLKPGKRKHNIA